MVAFGRPKGERSSYRQWREGNIPPQVVFEILSDSNKTAEGRREMEKKLAFYQQYGVEEYYIYDPDELTLEGWQRQGEELLPIEPMSDWVSPRLGIRFAWGEGQELVLYRPDGQRFLTSVELEERLVQEQHRAQQAQQRAELAETALEEERRQRQALLERLRELGLNPDEL
jgi:hypothetical protein